jgi:hypothetical protein
MNCGLPGCQAPGARLVKKSGVQEWRIGGSAYQRVGIAWSADAMIMIAERRRPEPHSGPPAYAMLNRRRFAVAASLTR